MILKSAIMEAELDDRGKDDKTIDGGNQKHNIKCNLVELNKAQKEPQRCFRKKDVLINSCSESCLEKRSVKILERCL